MATPMAPSRALSPTRNRWSRGIARLRGVSAAEAGRLPTALSRRKRRRWRNRPLVTCCRELDLHRAAVQLVDEHEAAARRAVVLVLDGAWRERRPFLGLQATRERADLDGNRRVELSDICPGRGSTTTSRQPSSLHGGAIGHQPFGAHAIELAALLNVVRADLGS